MPIYDGTTKIESLRLGGTEIIEVRLGGTAVFPDSVGAPIIETFTASAATLPYNGGNITLTITGTEGATFALTASGPVDTTFSGPNTIPASGTTAVTWSIPETDSGSGRNFSATISATGVSALDGDITATVTVVQDALQPAIQYTYQGYSLNNNNVHGSTQLSDSGISVSGSVIGDNNFLFRVNPTSPTANVIYIPSSGTSLSISNAVHEPADTNGNRAIRWDWAGSVAGGGSGVIAMQVPGRLPYTMLNVTY